MRVFSEAEMAEIREDWRRNGDAATKERLRIVAELHAADPEEIAGIVGAQMPPKRPKLKSYDQAVKDDVLKAVLIDGAPARSVAERYCVPESTVATWLSRARKKQAEIFDFAAQVEGKAPADNKKPPADNKKPPAEEPKEAKPEVDVEALLEAADGLLTFADLFEDVAFLDDKAARFLQEMADQAINYAKGIQWAMTRR